MMTTHDLPLRRYFLFVGGGLLALLFLLDAVLTSPARKSSASDPNFPVIRIHSELKGPPAVVIDTSQRVIAPVIAVQDDGPMPPAPFVMPDSRVRESFAQFVLLSKKQRAPMSRRSRSEIRYPNVSFSRLTSSIQQFVSPSIRISRPIGEPREQE
jgi:hypothetical protein